MKQIFKDHGSIRALALDLGLPYTTVHSWKVRGRIPFEYHDAVVLSCSRRDVPTSHTELRDAAIGHSQRRQTLKFKVKS